MIIFTIKASVCLSCMFIINIISVTACVILVISISKHIIILAFGIQICGHDMLTLAVLVIGVFTFEQCLYILLGLSTSDHQLIANARSSVDWRCQIISCQCQIISCWCQIMNWLSMPDHQLTVDARSSAVDPRSSADCRPKFISCRRQIMTWQSIPDHQLTQSWFYKLMSASCFPQILTQL